MKDMKAGLVVGSVLLLASCNQEPLPDTAAPTVALEASPATLTTSGDVTLRATASDDKGVTRVSFYRGDTLLGTDQTAPFEATDTVSVQSAGRVSYRAVAEDAAGNKAEARKDVTLSLSEIAGTVVEGDPQAAADGTPLLTLKPWTGGSGAVTLTLPGMQANTTLAQAALAADGSFRVALPAPSADLLQPVGSPSCPSNVTISDPQAQGSYGFLSVSASKTGEVRPLKLLGGSATGAVTLETGALIYVDRALTINGTSNCSFFAESFENLTLRAGWNKVHLVEQYGENGSRTFTYSNAAFLNNWVYLNGPAETTLKAQSVNPLSRPLSLFR